MYTMYNNHKSDIKYITYGVPQGSVLGPLIFLLYINDLPNAFKSANPFMFADDTTITLSSKSNDKLFEDMNTELKSLDNWFKTNKLSLNLTKTKFVLFRSKHKKDINKNLILKINDITISRVTNFNFLGIHFDEFLSWDKHTSVLIKKLSYGLYILRSAKHIIPINLLRTIYFSTFESHLRYGIIVWNNTSGKNLKKIMQIQKRAIRILHKDLHNDITDMFRNLKILKLKHLITKEYAVIIYRKLHNMLPPQLSDIFTINEELHQYETRQRHNPHIEPHRLQKNPE